MLRLCIHTRDLLRSQKQERTRKPIQLYFHLADLLVQTEDPQVQPSGSGEAAGPLVRDLEAQRGLGVR
jgi:hypothetical protein